MKDKPSYGILSYENMLITMLFRNNITNNRMFMSIKTIKFISFENLNCFGINKNAKIMLVITNKKDM